MPPSQTDYWLAATVMSLAATSLITCIALLNRPRPILRYELRQPVPWSGAASWLAVFFVLMVVVPRLVALLQGADDETLPPVTPAEHVEQLALDTIFKFVLIGGGLVAVIASSNATRSDLGLPESTAGVLRDVKIGVVAWLAALAPVYATQLVLVAIFGQPEGHPLIQMISKDPNPLLFVAAFAVAVIAAPIGEEIMFRLLVQGWLEKWEDARLGWRGDSLSGATVGDDIPATEADHAQNDEARLTNYEYSDSGHSSFDIRHSPFSEPPSRGLVGLPHGWLPILASSLLFALAHFGYGPDPIPLLVLAIVLGYTYQRTHRILPCIVAHALFNLMAFLALWRIAHGSAHGLAP